MEINGFGGSVRGLDPTNINRRQCRYGLDPAGCLCFAEKYLHYYHLKMLDLPRKSE